MNREVDIEALRTRKPPTETARKMPGANLSSSDNGLINDPPSIEKRW